MKLIIDDTPYKMKGRIIMKFICKQSVLNEAVNNVSRAVPVKSPVTALEGIKMYLNKNELELTGYDLELGIRTTIEVQSEDHGEFTVNAKLFSEIVRKLPDKMWWLRLTRSSRLPLREETLNIIYLPFLLMIIPLCLITIHRTA